MGGRRISDARIIKALHDAGGVVESAALLVPCHKDTIYEHAKMNPMVQAALDDARDEMDVVADDVLMAALRGKGVFADDGPSRLRAAMFVKNNSPASRKKGWGVRQTELTGANGGAIDINLDESERMERLAAILDTARTRRGGQVAGGEDVDSVGEDG